MIKIPILIYHAIDTYNEPLATEDKGKQIYIVGLEEFERQMKHLAENGFNAISLDDYITTANQKFGDLEKDKSNSCPDLPDKSVIITFDDGHISNHTHALPILQKYGFVATFFVTVGNIDTHDGLKSEQLREMADSGMSIQSHTMTHPFLSDLSGHQIHWELHESRSILEGKLGRPIKYLAIPGGRYNSIVKNTAREVGYRGVCTSIVGCNNINSDLYSLKRWVVRRDTDISTFSSIVSMKRSTAIYHKTRYFLLTGLKKTLGNRHYDSIRERFL